MKSKVTHKLFLLLVSLAAFACRTAPLPHYYLLSAEVGTSSQPAAPSATVIGIGPLEFPPYLDRTQLVVRRGGVEVELLELHRWAEPLERNFATVLAEQVAARTGADRVLVFPWSPGDGVERRVKGEVIRFDVDETGQAALVVRWQVQDGEGKVLVPASRSRHTKTASSGEPAAMVEALAETVAAFSDEVVASLGG